MTRTRTVLVGLASALVLATGVVALSPPASAASLVEVTNFGNNPGGMRMHIYVPDNRPANPPIVVAMHGCGGSGPGFYSGSEFASLSNQYGFIVIYPSAMQEAGFGRCFDTWSDASKRRGGGSDPVSIESMVNYARTQHGGDINRVYATGSSSGGMMTQHMLAVYPDLFKAGASFMGVPFGCFANAAAYPPGGPCTNGTMNRTPQEWGNLVRAAHPSFTGTRPPIQLWHGTNDTLVPYSLLQESIEQWTNVHGLSQTPTSTDTPQANWNRRRFGTQVEAYAIQGAGHSLPSSGMARVAIQFFGLDRAAPTTPPGNPTTPPGNPTTPPGNPTTPPGNPTTPPGGAGCSATVSLNQWTGGFVATVRVTAGSAGTNGWSVSMTLPGGASVTGVWNANRSGNSGTVQFSNVSYNGRLGSGQSTEFGFQGSGSGSGMTPSCTAS
ncbi:PHB depolymerase family esterase [Micromonospora sp. WMMD1102]|uniref:extracellular catalytic domain type 1 short-chain-length polyhydroxyalkanoate depolymerase n=1 Tax=Micromonospora sp. WMMD1102 TaxID=3016105 RepID=UPI0024152B8E|nr:PHB depolymerase family esterase [Micromonospora sp. WMMD1102]MDG4785343.1 PHB depolymerase family esterase [Micromonospora sp. WMMD1102]